MMRTGDHVIHKPSRETWVVAWADHETGYMAPCGWPECQAKIVDCYVIREASDDEYAEVCAELAASGRGDAHKANAIAAAIRSMGERGK